MIVLCTCTRLIGIWSIKPATFFFRSNFDQKSKILFSPRILHKTCIMTTVLLSISSWVRARWVKKWNFSFSLRILHKVCIMTTVLLSISKMLTVATVLLSISIMCTSEKGKYSQKEMSSNELKTSRRPLSWVSTDRNVKIALPCTTLGPHIIVYNRLEIVAQ